MKKTQGRRSERESPVLKTLAVAVASLFAGAAGAQALPTGYTSTAGNTTMNTVGAAMSINQTTPRAIIDWTTFNIGSGASVAFTQPGATSVAVNRVSAGGGSSTIAGGLSANGHVMLLNPNGVAFTSTAVVNVGGLIASTGNINDTDFMSSPTAPIAITGATAGAISNQGAITVAGAGLAAFVAPSVSNSGTGTITATSGRIMLASAQAATISLNGGLYEIAVNAAAPGGSVSNTGTLSATGSGGSITLSAGDAANLVSGVINLQGVQQANAIVVNGNTVELSSVLQAPSVSGNSATVNVHAGAHIQDGINITGSGGTVNVDAGTYAEQLTVAKSLILAGAGANSTIIAPASLVADASGLLNILTIGGSPANSVEVNGFTIQGPIPNINYGIFVRDGAHADIRDNNVVNIRFDPLSGVQQGIAIRIGSAALNTSGTAVIENNVITGYQKGGIVVDGPGTQATITGNTVTGAGPTGVTAQNGIQISRGASATVTGNTVSGNSYTGNDEATGILIFTPGANLGQGSVTIGPNTVSGNQVGIYTNDPNTLATISLTGISSNTRNAEADFTGGFAGQAFLEYPAWAASNVALASAATFGGTQAGDIVAVGGALRVSGWSGFTAIQPAINAVAAGGTVNVGAGTYAESVVLNGPRNLTFDGSTVQGLTINAGAAGSGIGGGVTANTATGFLFNAPVVLLSNTSLSTAGANITLNGDIQNAAGGPYTLSLAAGAGNVNLVSGGTAGNPLGMLTVSSNNFTLTGTLWVSGFSIDALGLVALSDHTLRSVGTGATNTINAGSDVIGSTISESGVQIQSGGDVIAHVTAPTTAIDAAGDVQVVLQTGATVIHAGGNADLSGSSSSVVLDAPGGSVSGNFSQVSNVGTGLISVNGRPEGNTTVSANADNSRVIPSDSTISGNSARNAAVLDDSGPVAGSLSVLAPDSAGDMLDRGLAVELDLTPGRERRR